MGEQLGIKETKEAVVGLNELTILIAKHLKDGAQVADALAILDEMKNNVELKAALELALENIKAVPAEIKDLSIGEGLELVVVQAKYVPKLLEALKKA